eukprot:SAG31_NODE_598_length_13651_cov_10.681818_1_plen_116_part_00
MWHALEPKVCLAHLLLLKLHEGVRQVVPLLVLDNLLCNLRDVGADGEKLYVSVLRVGRRAVQLLDGKRAPHTLGGPEVDHCQLAGCELRDGRLRVVRKVRDQQHRALRANNHFGS